MEGDKTLLHPNQPSYPNIKIFEEVVSIIKNFLKENNDSKINFNLFAILVEQPGYYEESKKFGLNAYEQDPVWSEEQAVFYPNSPACNAWQEITKATPLM